MDDSNSEEKGEFFSSDDKLHSFVTKQVESDNENETDRVSITTEEEARQWLNCYQKITKTHWIVAKTFPNPVK